MSADPEGGCKEHTVMPVFPHLRKNCSLAEITQVSAVDPLTNPKEKKT